MLSNPQESTEVVRYPIHAYNQQRRAAFARCHPGNVGEFVEQLDDAPVALNGQRST